MSSNLCQNCPKTEQTICEQKSKLNLIEIRLKDLIKAYKRVSVERDHLLSITSTTVLPLNDSHEQQKRMSCLEDSIADMSAICGKYESQSLRDQQLIQELTQKCEQLTIDLKCNQLVHKNTSEEQTKPEKTYRQRGVQTEEWIDLNEDIQTEVINESKIMSKEVETQTDLDVFNGSNVAVVLPTISETIAQNDLDLDSDQLSNRTRSRSQSLSSNLDSYPVFASNAREMSQNNDLLFSTPSSTGVSLFYANELALKEITLAETRLQAREYECALRELQWKYNTEKYRLQTRINDLEKNFSQMSSTKPLNELNITYIRNVLLKLLNTKDKHQKQFMINAILTALDQKDRKSN